MIFKGQYLTYEDYIGLGGTELTHMPFNLLEFEARRKIDGQTKNRLVNASYDKIPQEVKICMYNLINSIKEVANTTANGTTTGNVASESIDGYSVNYLTADKIGSVVSSMNEKINDIITTYLFGVIYNQEHLLYIGV